MSPNSIEAVCWDCWAREYDWIPKLPWWRVSP